MSQLLNSLTCLVFGHVVRGSVNFNRGRQLIERTFVCDRCGKKLQG